MLREQSIKNELIARAAEQRKNDLIVYLAHDLKTPLTSVIGYLNRPYEFYLNADIPTIFRTIDGDVPKVFTTLMEYIQPVSYTHLNLHTET